MWECYLPVRIYFGAGLLESLPELAGRHGIGRAALFLNRTFAASERVRTLRDILGDKLVLVVDDIGPDPDARDIDSIAERMRGHGVEGAIAIGGGSVIDTAKAASAVYANNCPVEDLLEKRVSVNKSLPLAAVPTTSGAGSEVTRAAALVYKGEKRPVFDDNMYAAAAVIDPTLTLSCPPALTASCGMDVLSHALEALMQRAENAVSEALAMDAVRLALANLERCYSAPDDLAARTAMSAASLKAGMAISISGCSAPHACSYALTTEYRVPHGEACAFTLDHILRLSARHDGRMDGFAARLGFDRADSLAARIGEMKRNMNMRVTLGQIGAADGAAEALAKAACGSAVMKNHYFDIGYEDVLEIFSGCTGR